MQRVPAGDNAFLVELGDVTAAELHAAARAMRAEAGVAAVIPGHSSLYVIRRLEGGCLNPVILSRVDGEGPPAVHSERAAAKGVVVLPVHDARAVGRGSFASHPPRPLAQDDSLETPSEATALQTRRIRVSFDGPDLEELFTRVPREEFFARLRDVRLTVRYLGFRGGFGYLDGWPEEWAMPRRPTSRPHVRRGTFGVAGAMAGFYPIDSPGGWNLLGHTEEDLEHKLTPGDVLVIVPMYAEVVASPLCTIVTEVNYANLDRGLPPGGAFDDVAAAAAASAVSGNVELLECAMVGPRLRFLRDAVTAWCGPDRNVETRRVTAGQELDIGRIAGGMRGYLAMGEQEATPHEPPATSNGDRLTIHAMRGPHDIGLESIDCEVTPQLNRIGIRLRPLQPIRAEIPADLRSCGMQCGTVQLHPDGSIVVMGPDHPVTGGYLQPMTVLTGERWKLAQLVPGERVTLISQPPKA